MHRRTLRIRSGLTALSIMLATTAWSQDVDLSVYQRLEPATEPSFSSFGLQAAVRTPESLGALATANSSFGDEAASFGFAAKSPEAQFFLIGAAYAEALALVRSGSREAAVERLRAIELEAVILGFPSPLYNYIAKVRAILERKEPYPTEVELAFLSLFQPFFEDYARGEAEDKLTLFRAGSWLVDLGLVVAAGNTQLLQQSSQLDYFRAEMERMDAPKGVQDALAEISNIAAQDEVPERDARKVLDLVESIQSLLG